MFTNSNVKEREREREDLVYSFYQRIIIYLAKILPRTNLSVLLLTSLSLPRLISSFFFWSDDKEKSAALLDKEFLHETLLESQHWFFSLFFFPPSPKGDVAKGIHVGSLVFAFELKSIPTKTEKRSPSIYRERRALQLFQPISSPSRFLKKFPLRDGFFFFFLINDW